MMKNKNVEKISRLKDIIHNQLLPLIDDDYSLLDIPYHNNIGDSLIFLGELQFLKSVSHSLLYRSSAKFGKMSKIPREGILLLHGGGNFGDIWQESHNFRRKLIRERPHQRIILFPQTVHYSNEDLIEKDAEIFNAHTNLTLCARDNYSFILLKKYFNNCKILLVPDMAFCLDFGIDDSKGRRSNLFLKRNDLENSRNDELCMDYIKSRNLDAEFRVSDWPGMFYGSALKRRLYNRCQRLEDKIYYLSKVIKMDRFLIDDCYGFESKNKGHILVQKGIGFFYKFDIIFTNRLHGMILALLLGKVVVCFDNSYGKNFAFYQTWLSDFENCSFKTFE